MVRFARGEDDTPVRDPLLGPLFSDMIEAEDLLTTAAEGAQQFARRTYYRTSFAYLEGHLYWLKTNVERWLLMVGWEKNNVEVTKIALLDDRAYRPDRTGNVTSEKNRVPFLNWCAFILRTGADCMGADAAKFFGDNGWSELQRALDVRHRLTHPKCPEDLQVTEAEIETLRGAHTWFLNCIVDIVNAAAKWAEARGHKLPVPGESAQRQIEP